MLKELECIGGTMENLQNYECKVIHYTERLRILVIRMYDPQKEASAKYLNFLAVHYFEGPILWTGANFAEASKQVSIDVWRRVYPEISEESVEKMTKVGFSVCTVQSQGGIIKIAYGGLSIAEEGPISPN